MIKKITNRIRRYFYKIKYGKRVIVYGKDVDLKNVEFEDAAFVSHNAEMLNCRIGNHTSIGRYTKIRDAEIGKYCSISWDCTIGAPTHPFNTITSSAVTYRREYGIVNKDIDFKQKKTVIGNDVWIGCGVTIISGVHIDDGAVIGAGAVVTQDVCAYDIVAGIPAKKIGCRFDNDMVRRLKSISWWNWSEDIQKKFIDLFSRDLDENTMAEIEIRYELLLTK